MNITRDGFISIINSLIKQIERDNAVGESIDKIIKNGDNFRVVYRTPLVEEIMDALDYDKIIAWWFFDGPQCGKRAEEYTIQHENVRVVIRDAGDLYDYMTKGPK